MEFELRQTRLRPRNLFLYTKSFFRDVINLTGTRGGAGCGWIMDFLKMWSKLSTLLLVKCTYIHDFSYNFRGFIDQLPQILSSRTVDLGRELLLLSGKKKCTKPSTHTLF